MKASALLVGACLLGALIRPAAAQLLGVPEAIAPLARFDGTWFETAGYGSWWQRRCVSDTALTFTARTVTEGAVRSTCRTAKGAEQRDGHVVSTGGDGKWRSHFVPRAFAWLPAVWGDFWVLGHDEAMTWFVVGERGHQRLAVFSRTTVLDEASRAMALAVARQAGFDVGRLVDVPHHADAWRDLRPSAALALVPLERVEAARPIALQ